MTVIARSEATKQSSPSLRPLDCFAEPVIGRRSAPTRWLAMTISVGLLALSPLIAAEPGHFGYGRTASQAEIAGWDIDVRGDDGAGLPPGKGTVHRGAELYADQCAACHGAFGEGEGRFPKLVGGNGTLRHDRPELTVGSYWPFAPTLWDYINRACRCRRRTHCQPMTFML
jgi:hypothetical protein